MNDDWTLKVNVEPPVEIPANDLGAIIEDGETVGYGFSTECTHNERMALMLFSMVPAEMSFGRSGFSVQLGECKVVKVKVGDGDGALVPVEVEILRVPE